MEGSGIPATDAPQSIVIWSEVCTLGLGIHALCILRVTTLLYEGEKKCFVTVVELSTSIDEIVLPQDILEQVKVFIYNFSIWSLSSGTNKLITFPKWCLFQKYDHHASLRIQGWTYQHFCSFSYGPCKYHDSLVSERVSGKQPCVPNTEQVPLPLLHLRPLKAQD